MTATEANPERAAPPRGRPDRFWTLQLLGWGSYAVAMAVSRLGIFPLGYMAVSKTLLAVLGLCCSLALREVYRRLLRDGASVTRLVLVAVAASYGMALVWTAADNLTDLPIAQAMLGRVREIRGPFDVFVGSVYNAFTLLAWSVLYLVIKRDEALALERERALRAESLASQARLDALRFQLQPHFLFNSLNAISTLVVEGRSDEASKMLSRLSDFLRLVLDSPGADTVTLAEELDFAERYLAIERVRFGDRLEVRVEVAEETLGAPVPALLLQPIVENAVRHGIAPRERGGSVEIVATRAGGELVLAISDRGRGAANGGVPAESNGERIGLANLRERLERRYGEAHRFTIEADGDGTRVEIALPFRGTAA
ncbi:MAG: sensor histidine kinase [Gemmatimonadales bacterium]